MQPKMGKMDIDYQVCLTFFFIVVFFFKFDIYLFIVIYPTQLFCNSCLPVLLQFMFRMIIFCLINECDFCLLGSP